MTLLNWPLAIMLGLCLHAWAASASELITGTIPFSDIKIFYQMYDSGRAEDPVVLFLHGKAFTSDVWLKQGTMQLVHSLGFKAIAIDLPGFGQTKHLPYVDNNMRAEVVLAVLEFAEQKRNLTSVLISPSMSGYGQKLCGWVPVAPVGITSWGGPWEFTHKQVRLLAMYGERDPMKSQGQYITKLFLQSKLHIIQDAGHACYMDRPEEFHKYLTEFLTKTIDPHDRVEDMFKKNDL